MIRSSKLILAVAVSGLAIGAFVLAALDAGGPVRTAVVLGFLLVGPGTMLVARTGIDDRFMALVLVLPVSLSIDALVAMVFLYAEAWNPTLVLGVIVLGTLAAALPDLVLETSKPDRLETRGS
jgi:hypothetical protein